MRRLALAVTALAVVVGLAPASAQAQSRARDRDVTVMSRNLYLGGDLLPLVGARTREEFEQRAAELVQSVQATNFPERAKAIAREIDRYGPDLIGLQEVSLWRRGADGVKDGPATPATTVVYDFLAILRRELRARRLSYRVARSHQGFDFEAPTALGYDARLTIYDVVLARTGRRAGLRVSRPRSGTYTTRLTVPTAVGSVSIPRGWVSVDGRKGGRSFRFVDTHLESFVADTRTRQAAELVARGGPLGSKRPTILIGDLNSDPAQAAPESDAFRNVTRAGFVDAAPRVGPTFGFSADLRTPTFDKRIDHVLSRPRLRARGARAFGKSAATPSGLPPSDHAGVVATLRLR